MDNAHQKHYLDQAKTGQIVQIGNGLTFFEGQRYQRGHGFFGSIFRNILKPLGRYLGKQALQTGVSIGSDILQGDNIKDTLKKNMKSTSNKVLDDAITRVKKFAQTGSGRKRKLRKRKAKKKVKRAVRRRRRKVKSKNKSVLKRVWNKKAKKNKSKKKTKKKTKKKSAKFSFLNL
jgi:hypothetical protein